MAIQTSNSDQSIQNIKNAKRIMQDMLKESRSSYATYMENGNRKYLQTASEQLFNAYSNYLQFKYSVIVRNHSAVWSIVRQHDKDVFLMGGLEQLHTFFYHGNIDMGMENAVYLYEQSLIKIQNKINNL